MVLPLIFGIVGVLGGLYGIYQHYNQPKCQECKCRLTFNKQKNTFLCTTCNRKLALQ